MAQCVEGKEWKNFVFRMLTFSDLPLVSHHMVENFFPDEPISSLVGNSQLKFKDYEKVMGAYLPENLSFAAYDKQSGKLAGVCLISRQKSGGKLVLPNFESIEIQITRNFLTKLDNAYDVCSLFNVPEYATIRVASVDRDFRQQGLASELVGRALNFLKESGFHVVKSIFSSPYTRALGEKFGFKELGRIYTREIEDLQGNLMCPQADDQEISILAVVRI